MLPRRPASPLSPPPKSALSSASAGQVVCLADGTYGSLSLTGSKASPGVTLQAANPGNVTVGSVSASGSGYTVSHLIGGSATCDQGAKNIVFDHMKISGEASAYGSSSSAAGPCTWQYSEIGPQSGSGEKDSDRCWVNCVGLTWKDNLIHVANEDGSHNDGFQGTATSTGSPSPAIASSAASAPRRSSSRTAPTRTSKQYQLNQ